MDFVSHIDWNITQHAGMFRMTKQFLKPANELLSSH